MIIISDNVTNLKDQLGSKFSFTYKDKSLKVSYISLAFSIISGSISNSLFKYL